MGEIKEILAYRDMPDRDLHHCRIFVDLGENVHIHFRDLRTVYSVPEFFEYADVVSRSGRDLKRYLKWHPQYKEQEVSDGIMVALGPNQQTRPLRKSPKPNQSTYFDNRLQIELQGEKVIDEIHIHFRDYRLVMDRDTFRTFAGAMSDATATLEEFLANNTYERIEHPFRREVVKDTYYESSQWTSLPRTRIPFSHRIGAIGFYLGGERLEGFLKRGLGLVRRRGSGLARKMGLRS